MKSKRRFSKTAKVVLLWSLPKKKKKKKKNEEFTFDGFISSVFFGFQIHSQNLIKSKK